MRHNVEHSKYGGQEQTYSKNKKQHPKGRSLANHDLINPLGLYVVYAPIWNLPATLLYRCPVTVLEWNSGYVFVQPPVAKLEPLISHHSRSSALMRS